MNKLYFLLFGFASLASCGSAKKSYDKGDYETAITLGIKQLQKDPSDVSAQQIIKDAYDLAVTQHESEIRSLSMSKSDDRFGQMYQQYNKLQALYLTIQTAPAAARYVKPNNYSEYLEIYRNKAVEMHIDRATEYVKEGNKKAFREAYQQYKMALRYTPKDDRLLRKKDSAYDAALTKVVVVPLQYNMPYGYANSYQVQNFQNEVLRTLTYNMNQEFIKFYSEWDARSQDIEPDQIMELALGRIFLGQPYDRTSRKEVSKKVVVKETTYKPDSVVKEYATVRATMHYTERTLLSQGELFITLRDKEGRIIWNDRFTGEHQWQTRFATYTGDDRALSDGDRSQLNQAQTNTPREEEVLEELFRRIQNDLAYRLRNYYARY